MTLVTLVQRVILGILVHKVTLVHMVILALLVLMAISILQRQPPPLH